MADETYGLKLEVDASSVSHADQIIAAMDEQWAKIAHKTVPEASAEIYKFATIVRDANQSASQSFAQTTAEVYGFADAEEQSADKVRHAKMGLEEYIATQIKVADSQRTLTTTAGAAASRFGNMNTLAQQAAYGLGDFASASGGLGAKLMAVSNNVQFVAAQFGPWGAALGLVIVGIAAAIKNADQFSGILNDQYIKPDVINRTAQLTDEIQANGTAFEKLRDKTALSAAELKEFNTLQAEGLRLQREKLFQDELDKQNQAKSPETEQRGKNAETAFAQVGAAQAQHDIESLLLKANPGMSRDLARQQAEALRANAGLGQKEANEYLELLFGSKEGAQTETGVAFNGRPGTASREEMKAKSEEERKANARKAEDAMAKARKQFGAQAWAEWQALDRHQRDQAFQPGDKEHDAFRRWAQARGERLIAEAEADPEVQRKQKEIDEAREADKRRGGLGSDAKTRAEQKRREEEAAAHARQANAHLAREHPVLDQRVKMEQRRAQLEREGKSLAEATHQAIAEGMRDAHTPEQMRAHREAAAGLARNSRMLAQARAGTLPRPRKKKKGPVDVRPTMSSHSLVPTVSHGVAQTDELIRIAENMGITVQELRQRQREQDARIRAMLERNRTNNRRGN